MWRWLLATVLILAGIWLHVFVPAVASPPASLGWDFTYQSVLEANAVERRAWLSKWLRQHKAAPIPALLERWPHERIKSAILMDVPAPHAAERVVHFLARTGSAAYAWIYTDGKPEESQDKPIDPGLFDSLIDEVSGWSQAPPLPKERAGDEVPPGYYGFLSLHVAGRSKQMLLTFEDFHVRGKRGWEDATDGRLLVALRPLAETYE